MKILFFYLFVFTMVTLMYPFTPVALYKKKWNNVPTPKLQKVDIISLPTTSNKKGIQKEHKKATHHLNQRYFGISDYEKAQRELREFNRPLIGIVGKDSDWISYREYQKKILGSTY